MKHQERPIVTPEILANRHTWNTGKCQSSHLKHQERPIVTPEILANRHTSNTRKGRSSHLKHQERPIVTPETPGFQFSVLLRLSTCQITSKNLGQDKNVSLVKRKGHLVDTSSLKRVGGGPLFWLIMRIVKLQNLLHIHICTFYVNPVLGGCIIIKQFRSKPLQQLKKYSNFIHDR